MFSWLALLNKNYRWIFLVGAVVLLSTNARLVLSQEKIRVVCEGSINYWTETGRFEGSNPQTIFFSVDLKSNKMTLDGGYYASYEYQLAPERTDIYYASHSLKGKVIHGKETSYVFVELNRFSGKGVQGIVFTDGSTHWVFRSESGCGKADKRF